MRVTPARNAPPPSPMAGSLWWPWSNAPVVVYPAGVVVPALRSRTKTLVKNGVLGNRLCAPLPNATYRPLWVIDTPKLPPRLSVASGPTLGAGGGFAFRARPETCARDADQPQP